MPFITVNGQLQEVSQAEYDIYTIGQKMNPAAGGNVVQLNNTQTILTPNTTNNTPGQTLPTLQEQINAVARATGDDPNAPVSAEAQEIFNIGQRLNGNTIGTSTVSTQEQEVTQFNADPANIPVETNDQNELVDLNTGEVYGIDPNSDFLASEGGLNILPEELNADEANVPDGGLVEFTNEGSIVREPSEVSETALYGTPYDDDGNLNPGWELDGDGNPYYKGYSQGKLWINPNTAESAEASRVEALRNQARQQQTISQQRKTINNGDWRVKLRLAPHASYLYKSATPGILKPLQVTDGIIFPYTPSIDTAYKANYSHYDLTHSNYRGYFYQNSYVDPINLRCMFTAQSTSEADYLLATIHFLKSLTKMFYGQDAEAGSPPPLVYLSGLGQYQFNEHPCLLGQFNYTLPSDVDYIRAGSNNINNTNLSLRRSKQTSFAGGLLGNFLGSAVNRLMNAGLPKGGITAPPAPNTISPNNGPTYVPTKMEISINLFPVQSRQQVSKQFSVKQFASGDLLKGGFW